MVQYTHRDQKDVNRGHVDGFTHDHEGDTSVSVAARCVATAAISDCSPEVGLGSNGRPYRLGNGREIVSTFRCQSAVAHSVASSRSRNWAKRRSVVSKALGASSAAVPVRRTSADVNSSRITTARRSRLVRASLT